MLMDKLLWKLNQLRNPIYNYVVDMSEHDPEFYKVVKYYRTAVWENPYYP